MKKFIIYTLLLCWVFTGCKKKEYLYQDVSARIWLGLREALNNGPVVDSSETSFARKPVTMLTDTLYIGVNLTGHATPADRTFKLEVVSDSTNVLPGDYTLGEAVIPAHAFAARIPVIVKKNVQALNLTKQKAVLMVRFVPDGNFLQGEPFADVLPGYVRDKFRIIWFNFLAPPPTWPAIQSITGVFTQAKYKFIIDMLGISEFSRFQGNNVALLSLQAALRKALNDYNNDPANAGRPEGWPYLDDNGTPLKF